LFFSKILLYFLIYLFNLIF